VADAPPPWKGLPNAQVEFVRWTETAEREAVRGMSVGLMPLADEPWAKGKCAAKMLVYAAAAIPSVVTPVGVNGDILAKAEVGLAARTTAEWLGALEALYSDRARVAAMGQAGEALVREEYSVAVNAGRLAAIFEEVAEAARRG
jgi:glycosyltransferase involved in cell wall biosynthesis